MSTRERSFTSFSGFIPELLGSPRLSINYLSVSLNLYRSIPNFSQLRDIVWRLIPGARPKESREGKGEGGLITGRRPAENFPPPILVNGAGNRPTPGRGGLGLRREEA